jgi:hypothetical protein
MLCSWCNLSITIETENYRRRNRNLNQKTKTKKNFVLSFLLTRTGSHSPPLILQCPKQRVLPTRFAEINFILAPIQSGPGARAVWRSGSGFGAGAGSGPGPGAGSRSGPGPGAGAGSGSGPGGVAVFGPGAGTRAVTGAVTIDDWSSCSPSAGVPSQEVRRLNVNLTAVLDQSQVLVENMKQEQILVVADRIRELLRPAVTPEPVLS